MRKCAVGCQMPCIFVFDLENFGDQQVSLHLVLRKVICEVIENLNVRVRSVKNIRLLTLGAHNLIA